MFAHYIKEWATTIVNTTFTYFFIQTDTFGRQTDTFWRQTNTFGR